MTLYEALGAIQFTFRMLSELSKVPFQKAGENHHFRRLSGMETEKDEHTRHRGILGCVEIAMRVQSETPFRKLSELSENPQPGNVP